MSLAEDKKEELTEIIGHHFGAIKWPAGLRKPEIKSLGRGAFGAAYLVEGVVIKVIELNADYIEGALHSESLFKAEVAGWEELSGVAALSKYLPVYMGHSYFKYVPDAGNRASIQAMTGRTLFMQPAVKVFGCIFQLYEPVQPLDQVITDMKIAAAIGSKVGSKTGSKSRSAPRAVGAAARLLRDETTAARFLNNLIRAYTYLHRAGYVHRDIKPGNILVRTTEDLVDIPIVIDIGLLCKSPCTDTALAGTYRFLPPNYLNRTNRRRGRTFNVNDASGRGLAKRIKEGLFKSLGLRFTLKKPYRSSKSKVQVKTIEQVKPIYNKHTDNYALAITMQDFIQGVRWTNRTMKEYYEQVAHRYIMSMSAFLAAAREPLKILERDRKNANAIRRLIEIERREEPFPPLPDSNSEEE